MAPGRVAVLVFALLLAGTTAEGARAEADDAPVAPAPPTAPERLAQLLSPEEYPRAPFMGAQAEVFGVQAGVSSLVVGFDWVRFQLEVSAGLAVGGDPLEGTSAPDSYAIAVRAALPVHRGIRADFALLAGGGAAFLTAPVHKTIGLAVVGARFRVFMTPNVATVATLGAAATIGPDQSSLVVGARPLGAAGVVYFFR